MRNLNRLLPELKEMQWTSFQNIVKFAYDHVPFYRNLYDRENFHPDQLKHPDNIQKIPKIRKSMFQEAAPATLIADNYDISKLVRKRTSGSSGSPLNVFYTPEDRIYRTLLHLRIFFHNGMGYRDKMAHISDSRNVPDFRYGFQKLGFLPKDFVYAADPIGQQMERLVKIKPSVIYSYASSMVLLSSEIEKLGKCPFHPKNVFTTGELLNPDDRELINQAFCVKLRDIYGVVEMGDVAWECPELNGYHLSIDSYCAEVFVGDRLAEPGEAGQLVMTNLHSHAMPFIRYEVGDIVTAPQEEPCSCGCNFPRIGVLQGRADDWLYTPDKKRISPLIFVVASIPGVQQYRMIQKDYVHIRVEILPGPGFSDETLQQSADHVIEVMGPGMEVEAVKVGEIPQQAGKMRRVISEINRSLE
jgi:phenylacetate-CoA ligase